ncbi:MAG: cell wall hydrolase [Clostridia bacterium]|jgi:N-acetylmuramoyl-L-alanine amidase|nr:cell wall hydrolase [Clostridia bacterium]
MGYSDRELIARIIQCEAGGEGENGMKAVASVIMNRVNASIGEYSRVSQGGSIRNIIFQPRQFDCASEELLNRYNPQNIYNMTPTDVHYNIADWVMAGNRLNETGECLWYLNPFKPSCNSTFPSNGSGTLHTRLGEHCFYRPTAFYANT